MHMGHSKKVATSQQPIQYWIINICYKPPPHTTNKLPTSLQLLAISNLAKISPTPIFMHQKIINISLEITIPWIISNYKYLQYQINIISQTPLNMVFVYFIISQYMLKDIQLTVGQASADVFLSEISCQKVMHQPMISQ